MKIGIGFPARSNVETREYVEAATNYAFESLICYGDLGDLPPFMALGAYAGQLKNSEIKSVGPLGIPVGRMDAELLGSHARLLEEMLGEKALVGLVRGAFLDQIGQHKALLEVVEDAIGAVRRQAPEAKIAIGGFGPKIIDLAAKQKVDYIKLGGSASLSLARHVLDTMPHAARPKLILGAVTVVDDDRRKARKLARQEVAKYLAVVGSLDPTLDPDQTNSLQDFLDRYPNDPLAPSYISDALLNSFSYSGTPEDIYERVLTDGTHVVDHIQFGTPHGLGPIRSNIAVLGEIAEALGEK